MSVAPRIDRAASSVWVLIAFLAGSVLVMAVVARAAGPASFEGWYTETGTGLLTLPMAVRSTVWYVELALVAAAAWLLWVYPQPGLRRFGVVVLGVNVVLAAVLRPVLVALVPEHGLAATISVAVCLVLLAGVLLIAALGLRRTHRLSALLLVPCILWTVYVIAIHVARAVAA